MVTLHTEDLPAEPQQDSQVPSPAHPLVRVTSDGALTILTGKESDSHVVVSRSPGEEEARQVAQGGRGE